MNKPWVVNASPIIVLTKAGLDHLFARMADEVLVPAAVAAEVMAGPKLDPACKLLQSGWGRIVSPDEIPQPVTEWGLGAGESEVIAVGLQTVGAAVILDDALARACARTLGLPVLGSLGVILRAKRRGLLSSAADAFTAVRDSGLYLDNATVAAALRSVGEQWDSH